MTDSAPYFSLWDKVPDTKSGSAADQTDPSIPDGEHRARLIGFDCFESKKGDIWLKWTFSVLGGMFDGRTLIRLSAPLGKRTDDDDYRQKQVGWARQDLRKVLGEVPPLMGGLLDPETRRTGPVSARVLNSIVSVTKQTKGERINVYINELIQASSSSAVPEFPGTSDPESWPDDEDRPVSVEEPDPDRKWDDRNEPKTPVEDFDEVPF